MKTRFLPFAFFLFLTVQLFAQWSPQAENLLPPNYSVMNLSIVNDQVVWAVAIDFNQWVPSIPSTHLPKVLRTTNGGADWSSEDFPQATGRMTYGIIGLDENTALLPTSDFDNTHVLFKTTNGGDAWNMVDDGPAAGGRLMFFDATEGVSVNPLFEGIARTDDGGESWTLLTPGVDYPAFLPNDGHLNAPTNWDIFGDTAWIGTSLGKLYRSTDKGQNWDVVYETGDITDKFISTAFVDGKNGLAVVGVFNNPPFKLLRTADGGEEWEEINNDANLSEIFAIPCTNSFIGASFYDSLTVWSTDLGTSWEILADGLSTWGPTFSSTETGWTAGIEGGGAPAVYKWNGGTLNGRTYVNHAATGNNDGTSWADAYTDLKDALTAAEEGDEIWVAEGTYLPGDDPTATFLIDKNLKLYGGFAGTECNLSERDIVAHPTILSGDVEGNDTLGEFFMDRDDNVESIMEITDDISSSTVIDGFTIKGGHANGTGFGSPEYGGGIFCLGAPVIRHCIFEQNFAKYVGGGMYIYGQDANGVTIENCRFQDNLQNHPDGIGSGGGLYMQEVTNNGVFIFHCHFFDNEGGMQGGGVSSWNSNVFVDSCTFTDNTSRFRGGGIIIWTEELASSTMSVQNSHFASNSSAFGGGAYVRSQGNEAEIDFHNNTFTNNTSVDPNEPGWGAAGGGMHFFDAGEQNTFRASHCDFTNNTAENGGGGFTQFIADSSIETTTALDNCSFSNNTAPSGGALGAELLGSGMTWELKNSSFANNTTTDSYATAYVWTFTDANASTGTAVVDNCIFENNISVYTGGLDIGSGTDSGPFDFTISNTSFLNNQATYCGGFDIWGEEGSKPTFHIENCLVEGNTADVRGGGFWILTSSKDFKATMDRCQILNNSSPQGAGITTFLSDIISLAFPENAEINISNSLISGNAGSAAIEIDSFPNFQLTNCTVVDNPLGAIQLSDESGLILQNTILHNNGMTEFEPLTSDVTVTSLGGNLIGDDSFDDYDLTYDSVEVSDPGFIGGGDYHLQSSSPAIDKGVDLGNLAEFDLDGNPRENGCVDIGAYESDVIVSMDCVTDAQEIMIGEIKLSPNPATNFVQLQLTEQITRATELSLFDAQGRLLERQPFKTGQTVQVGHLPSGFYTLKLTDGERVYVGKFIKQ